MKGDIFRAIADPTRRQIIDLVIRQELTLNEVAANFAISRPAISRHIRILTASGIITIRPQGRERYCKAHPDKLREVSEWIAEHQRFWEEKLGNLGIFLSGDDQKSSSIK